MGEWEGRAAIERLDDVKGWGVPKDEEDEMLSSSLSSLYVTRVFLTQIRTSAES